MFFLVLFRLILCVSVLLTPGPFAPTTNRVSAQPPDPVYFVSGPSDTVVAEGETAMLECVVGNYDPSIHRVSWSSRVSRDLASSTTTKATSGMAHSSLRLVNFTPADNYLYFCEIYSTTPHSDDGDILLHATWAVVSTSRFAHIAQCNSTASHPANTIYLWRNGPNVVVTCTIVRRDYEPKISTMDPTARLEDERYDNGSIRLRKAELSWNETSHLDGEILFCQGMRNGRSSARPCVLGLVRVVHPPRVVPSNTTLTYGLAVSEVLLHCDVRGLTRSACSFSWSCEPDSVVTGCDGDDDTVSVGVSDQSAVQGSHLQVRVECNVSCVQGFIKDRGQATVLIEPVLQTSTGSGDSVSNITDCNVVLEDDENRMLLRCYIDTEECGSGSVSGVFTWYVNGDRQVPDEESTVAEIASKYSTHRIYDLDINDVICCEVSVENYTMRVCSTLNRSKAIEDATTSTLEDRIWPTHANVTFPELVEVNLRWFWSDSWPFLCLVSAGISTIIVAVVWGGVCLCKRRDKDRKGSRKRENHQRQQTYGVRSPSQSNDQSAAGSGDRFNKLSDSCYPQCSTGCEIYDYADADIGGGPRRDFSLAGCEDDCQEFKPCDPTYAGIPDRVTEYSASSGMSDDDHMGTHQKEWALRHHYYARSSSSSSSSPSLIHEYDSSMRSPSAVFYEKSQNPYANSEDPMIYFHGVTESKQKMHHEYLGHGIDSRLPQSQNPYANTEDPVISSHGFNESKQKMHHEYMDCNGVDARLPQSQYPYANSEDPVISSHGFHEAKQKIHHEYMDNVVDSRPPPKKGYLVGSQRPPPMEDLELKKQRPVYHSHIVS